MRVLQIINSLATGGAEKLILDMVPLMNNAGVNTDVLILKNNDDPFYNLLQDEACCKIININQKSVYNPSAIFKIKSHLKNYDVVHVHLFPAQYFTILANKISFSKSPKFVFTEHNTTNKRIEKKWLHGIDRMNYKAYDKLICISQEIHDIMLQHTHLPKNKLTVVENGINLEKIYNAQAINRSQIDKNITNDDRLILQVSVFDRAKDQPTLIKALPLLPEKFKLVFAGEGTRMDDAKNLAKELNVQDRVFFLGIRKDIPQLLKTVDYVALSSKFEGLSIASLEGLASGKPFISTEVPGLTDVVKGAGLLFPYQDSQAFAKIILALDKDKEYHDKTVKSCLNRAKCYDIKNMTNKLIKVYEEVCS